MTRRTERALIALAALIAAGGTALASATAGIGGPLDTLGALAITAVSFGGLHLAAIRWAPRHASPFISLAAFLTAIGSIEVFRIDPDLGRLQRWWLLLGALLGSGVMWLVHRGGVQSLRRYRYLFLAGAMFLLFLPLLPASWPLRGAVVNGSRLWVRLDLPGSASLSVQPGEGAKVLLVVFFASFLAERGAALADMPRRLGPMRLPEPRQLLPVVLAFGVSFAVVVYQKDLGAALLLFGMVTTMLFAATGRAEYLGAGAGLVVVGGFAAHRMFDHVQVRVAAWLHPFDDFLDSGYQVAQGLFALGAGGLTGTGIGAGSPQLIPAAATDYVFAAVAEETGLAGSLAVLAAFGMLIGAGLGLAVRSRDTFRSLLTAGLVLTLAIQTALILAGVLRLLPLTGITLPFMSYGGSSLLVNLVIVALLVRISHEEAA